MVAGVTSKPAVQLRMCIDAAGLQVQSLVAALLTLTLHPPRPTSCIGPLVPRSSFLVPGIYSRQMPTVKHRTPNTKCRTPNAKRHTSHVTQATQGAISLSARNAGERQGLTLSTSTLHAPCLLKQSFLFSSASRRRRRRIAVYFQDMNSPEPHDIPSNRFKSLQ